ncbi:MAG TPA: hypothetical protein VN436_05340 [Holophaga sp.]|nr:hypothetical protein [Holophaga sp.]
MYVALAMILDGRESVAVPTWRKNGGSIKSFRPMPSGPLVLANLSQDSAATVRIFESDDCLVIAKMVVGAQVSSGAYLYRTAEIQPGKAITVIPRKAYIGVGGEPDCWMTLQPAGLMTRGPSGMPALPPMVVNQGGGN